VRNAMKSISNVGIVVASPSRDHAGSPSPFVTVPTVWIFHFTFPKRSADTLPLFAP